MTRLEFVLNGLYEQKISLGFICWPWKVRDIVSHGDGDYYEIIGMDGESSIINLEDIRISDLER